VATLSDKITFPVFLSPHKIMNLPKLYYFHFSIFALEIANSQQKNMQQKLKTYKRYF